MTRWGGAFFSALAIVAGSLSVGGLGIAQEVVVEREAAQPAVLAFPVLQAVPAPLIMADQVVEVAAPAEPKPETRFGGRPLIEFGKTTWKYLDTGAVPDKGWTQAAFDDDLWKEGRGVLGYGDDVATKLSYGDDASKKHITSYFRATFEYKKDPKLTGCGIWLIVDDAAVVYLNGEKVIHHNLPEEVNSDVTATYAISGGDEREKWPFQVASKHLVDGVNVVAVEVHQCNNTSSDLALDLEMRLFDKEEHVKFVNGISKFQTLELRMAQQGIDDVAAAQAQMAVLQPAQPPNQPATQQYYFSDGEVTYHMADGRTMTQRSDAIQQISQSFPYIRFTRAMAGDTIEKLAAQHGIDPDALRITNRAAVGAVFREDEVVCLRWKHRAMDGETLSSIAELYKMERDQLCALNGLSADAAITPGDILHVAGRYDHQLPQTHRGNQGHLMLTVVMTQTMFRQNPIINVGPMRQHAVVDGDTVESVAEKYKVTPEFLRRLNCMADDAELEVGDVVLASRKVRLQDGASVEDAAFASGVEIEDVLDVNDVATIDKLDTKQGFFLPRQLQRQNRTTTVEFMEGGFF